MHGDEIINVVICFLMALMNFRGSVVFNRACSIRTFIPMTKFVRAFVCTPSAEQLRPKGSKTMVGSAVAEHSNNLQKGGA